MCKLTFIFIILILLIILLLNKENFPYPISSPSTRNMSYDLRCEPRIPRMNMGPWRESSINYYHRPKCLKDI